MSDGSIVLRYTPEGENARRVRIEPRDDGRWDRLVEERRSGTWHISGHEIVSQLELEAPAAIIADDPVTTYRGP